MLDHLSAGKTIICDRYAYSGIAFSSAKGLDIEWCASCDRGLPAPDVTIYLKMDVDDAVNRDGYGAERYEEVEFQRKVKLIYENSLADDSWFIVNASRSIEEVASDILAAVQSAIERVQNSPIQTLKLAIKS